jgi:hypothetical protein
MVEFSSINKILFVTSLEREGDSKYVPYRPHQVALDTKPTLDLFSPITRKTKKSSLNSHRRSSERIRASSLRKRTVRFDALARVTDRRQQGSIGAGHGELVQGVEVVQPPLSRFDSKTIKTFAVLRESIHDRGPHRRSSRDILTYPP